MEFVIFDPASMVYNTAPLNIFIIFLSTCEKNLSLTANELTVTDSFCLILDKKQLTSKGSMFCQLFSTTINGFLMESDGSIISRIIRFKPSNPDQIAGTLQKITSFAVKQYPKLDGRGKSRYNLLRVVQGRCGQAGHR